MDHDYNILRANSDGTGSYWLDAADDLATAQNRIQVLSCSHPGEYFVFSQKRQRIVLIVTATGDILPGPRPLTR